MTRAEYVAAYEEARKATSRLSIKAQVQVKFAYRKAAMEVAKSLKAAQDKGLSLITITAQSQLLEELEALSLGLSGNVEQVLVDTVRRSAELNTKADQAYLTAIAGRVSSDQFSPSVIRGAFSRVNGDAVRNMTARMYSDEYTYSSRIWSLKSGFEDQVKDIITTGWSKGRDPVKLIKDIQVYVADGKIALADRWGRLERGTDEWKKRIPGQVDYRAQRLVRSEIQATVQATNLQAGLANPGTSGNYRWVLGPGLAHCAECLDYSGMLFTAESVPEYPHPNCGCQVRPELRDQDQFVSDLTRWVDGTVDDSNRYIEDWAQRYMNAA